MYEIEDYKLHLREICRVYKAPFSVTFMEGGYFHDDGTWVEENSLIVILLNVPEDTVILYLMGIDPSKPSISCRNRLSKPKNLDVRQ